MSLSDKVKELLNTEEERWNGPMPLHFYEAIERAFLAGVEAALGLDGVMVRIECKPEIQYEIDHFRSHK